MPMRKVFFNSPRVSRTISMARAAPRIAALTTLLMDLSIYSAGLTLQLHKLIIL
jgi:hypothetical protein